MMFSLHSQLPNRLTAGVIPALSFGLGALMAQGLAPSNWIWATPVSLIVIADLFLRATTTKQAALYGWLFGCGYFANGLQWILEPFQVDAQAHAWMAPFALLFLAAGLALFWGAAFALSYRLANGHWRILALIGWWGLAEFARAYLLTGFPWAGLAQLHMGTDYRFALLPFIGPHGVATLLLGATLPCVLFWRSSACALRIERVIPMLAPFCLAGAVGFVLLQQESRPDQLEMTDKTVRLVQPNAPQDQKWDPDLRWTFVQRQVDYSAQTPRPDLIVWPETSVPQWLNYAEDTLRMISSGARGVPIMLGIQREESGLYHNSAILLDRDGAVMQTYDKAHLVPFGEYVPFGDVMAKLGIHGLASQDGAGYAAGPSLQVIDTPVGKMLPLICYEAVFPQDIYQVTERPEMLTQITNDAWFGVKAGPQQHLVQAQMRAAEQGLPMIRVANTGISAMIDPYGRLRETIPLGEAGYIDAQLPAPLSVTLYSKTGDWPIFALVVLLVVAAGFSKALQQRHSRLIFP